MKKLIIKFLVISLLFLTNCATKLDVCECLSFKKTITDQYLLSEKELKEKEEGCEWIYQEYSDMELIQKWAECTKNEINQSEPFSGNSFQANAPDNNSTYENSESQTKASSCYYPVNENGDYDQTMVSLHYFTNGDGNKPYGEIRYTDGTTFTIIPNCEGAFNWCIRTPENTEIGYLKIDYDTEGEALFLETKQNSNSNRYSGYLTFLNGTFRLWN